MIGVYTLALCAALLSAWRIAQIAGYRAVGVAGFVLFAVASAACAQADTITVLLAGRAVQAIGGAGGLVAAFALLHTGDRPQRGLWLGAAVLSAALGPAVGGALTQAFDWRAIFAVQVPLALAGAAACALSPTATLLAGQGHRGRAAPGAAVALALISAALTGVLFLLILLLVAGWNVEPLAAAAAVTALPIGALAGSRIAVGGAASRAAIGCLLVGGGVLALAWLPGAHTWWTLPPQLMAGVGMGLSLPALGGQLLPERTPHDAAVLLTIRHAGIALALVLIAPIASDRLEASVKDARLQGVAIVLDARLAPQDKIALAPDLLASVDAQQPRNALRMAIADNRERFWGEDLAAYSRLGRRDRRRAGDRSGPIVQTRLPHHRCPGAAGWAGTGGVLAVCGTAQRLGRTGPGRRVARPGRLRASPQQWRTGAGHDHRPVRRPGFAGQRRRHRRAPGRGAGTTRPGGLRERLLEGGAGGGHRR